VIRRDTSCPARRLQLTNTRLIRLPAVALCDLYRTMLQSESYIPPLDDAKREVQDLLDLQKMGMFQKGVVCAQGCQRLGRVVRDTVATMVIVTFGSGTCLR